MGPELQQRILHKAKTAQPNLTGIPTQMKLNFEQHSGMSFDDVRVHYGSDRPAQLRALAYTQGRHVYIGPGQERHLGHELGHVVQQKLGQVAPTGRAGGLPINDDRKLEAEADHLAGLADRRAPGLEPPLQRAADPGGEQGVVQRVHKAFRNETYARIHRSEYSHELHDNARNVQQQGGAHSDILRASLVDDYQIPDPWKSRIDNQAHHIVETSNVLGQKILRKVRIESDSAVNGVLLPGTENDDAGDATIHSGRHIKMYTNCVTAALWNAVVPNLCERWGVRFLTVDPDSVETIEANVELYINFHDTSTIKNVLAKIRKILLEVYVPLNNGADGTYSQGDTIEDQILNAFRAYRLV